MALTRELGAFWEIKLIETFCTLEVGLDTCQDSDTMSILIHSVYHPLIIRIEGAFSCSNRPTYPWKPSINEMTTPSAG